ncbi:MAG: lactate racemase domain-containing protein [Nitrososphaerota archaeon]
MVEIWLKYGNTEIFFESENFQVFQPKNYPSLLNMNEAFQEIIKKLIDDYFLKKDEKIVFVIDDKGFPESIKLFINRLIEELRSLKLNDKNIIFLIASKNGKELKSKDLYNLFNKEAINNYKIICHNPLKNEFEFIGKTSFGTNVYLNKIFTEADKKILLGNILINPLIGYSSIGETIIPGIAKEETIKQNFSLILENKELKKFSEYSIHKDSLEAAKISGIDFSIYFLLNSNNEISAIFSGSIDEINEKSINLLNEIYNLKIDEKADIVVASLGGLPYDRTLENACDCLINLLNILSEKGVLIIVSECRKGLGSMIFSSFLEKDSKEIYEKLKKEPRIEIYRAYILKKFLEDFKMAIVSIIPKSIISELLKIKSYDNVSEALTYAFRIVGKNSKLFVIPECYKTIFKEV